MVTIAAFYHFAAMPDMVAVQAAYKALMLEHGVTGTILVTPEGLNATVAGPDAGVNALLAFIRSDARFTAMSHKTSYAETNPFRRTKVKLKRETIPLGVVVDPTQPGTYVKPEHWNALLADPRSVIIDTRNDYEVELGQFKGALNPKTRVFSELPGWLEKNLPNDLDTPVMMYCTGGIRCEKSTAYLKQQGYQNVYHLEGGILKYLEDVPPEQSLWQGSCFVFDERIAVGHGLAPVNEK